MSFSARYSLAILVAIFCVSTSLFGQTSSKQAAKVHVGSLSGRVTIKERGAPGVAVGIRKGEAVNMTEPFQRVITDQDGFYRLTNLAPGNYTITVSAPAFVMPNTFQSRYKTVLVGEDEDVEGINFSLIRGGVITGRVTDAEGRPVIEQQVQIFQAEVLESPNRERTMYPVGTAQTDDRGIYRVFGLSAGRYKAAAGRNDDGRNVSFNQPRNVSYRQVFHPDVVDHAKATIIEVSEGSEAANVDISLGRAIQTFRASGVVVEKESNAPVANLRFGVQRLMGNRTEPVNTSAMSNARGELTFEGLIPGKYVLLLYPNQGSDLRPDSLSFEITDHDLDDLTMRLARGASVSGMIVLENFDKAGFEKLLQLQLRGYTSVPSTGMALGSAAWSPIGPDGSFRLSGLGAGHVNLILATPATPLPPKGFILARIERDSVVAPQGLELKEGEQLTGIRLIVSYGTATIRGTVRVENGNMPEGGRIFVRLSRPNGGPVAIRPPTVDERGHFLLEGVPGGTYDLGATIGGAPIGGAPARMVKQSITVRDGVTMDVTIVIDLNPPLKP